jgi:hypothetical protein
LKKLLFGLTLLVTSCASGAASAASSVTASSVTVQVAAPASNSALSSPVHIQASAGSANPIVAWKVYVDGANLYSAGSTTTIDTSLSASTGSHRIVVRAWDSTGAYGDQTLLATLGTPTPPAPVPPPSSIGGATTLAAETGNNTSASSSFPGWNDGNMKPGNVSKVDIHNLLYPGATTKVYAHLMVWWGYQGHKNIGYTSWTPAQVTAQVNDMISRGITGAIIDYYGTARATEEQAVQLLFREAEKHPGFEIAIDLDKGAIDKSNVTASTVSQLKHIVNTFETSPAYMRKQGRPVVHFFGVESLGVTWSTVQSQVPGNQIYVFENSSGFSRTASGGAFSWVATGNPSDWGQSYLDHFYLTALSTPGGHTFGSAKKGFNDTVASWSLNRIVNQNCGQTWLNTIKEIGSFYSQNNQLESLQLVTWNDYEEGSEIETGIDNCIAVTQPSASGTTLSWGVQMTSSQATLNTVDHYTVYATQDGTNLTTLADGIPNTETSLDLSKYSVPSGSKYYVKAVGVSSITNHMSPESN